MSILNHFGKVKASYKKYEGDLPEYTGYVYNNNGYVMEQQHGNKIHHLDKLTFHQDARLPKIETSPGKMDYGLTGGIFTGILDPGHIYEPIKRNIPVPSWMFYNTQQPNKYLYMESDHTISISDTYYHSLSPETYVFSFTTLVETFSKCFEKVREKMYSDLWKTIECCPFINIMDLLILKQSDTDKHIEHVENMIRSLLDDNKLLQNRINALEAQMKRNTIPVAVVVKTIGEELVYESV